MLGPLLNGKSDLSTRNGVLHGRQPLQYLHMRKRILITKQHSIHSKNQSDEDDKMWRESWRRRRKRYAYFKQVTVVRLIRGISGNIGRVKRKGNEVPHKMEGNERERYCLNC